MTKTTDFYNRHGWEFAETLDENLVSIRKSFLKMLDDASNRYLEKNVQQSLPVFRSYSYRYRFE